MSSAVMSDNSSTTVESAIRCSKPRSDSKQQQPQSNSGRRTVKRWSRAGAGRSSNFTKGQWTANEDRNQKQLAEELGDKKLSEIVQGRLQNIKIESWTLQEKDLLIRLHRELGSKWAEIAKRIPGRTENNIKNLWNATKRRHDARRKSRRTVDGSEAEVPKLNHLREYILSVEAQKAKSRNISELNDGSQGYRGERAVCKDSDADMLSNITCDVSSKWNSTARFPMSSQTSIHSGLNANVEQILEQILQNGNVGTNVVQHQLQPCALKSFDGYKPHSPTIRNQTAAGWGLGGARNGSNNHVASTNVNNRGLWETHGGGDMAKNGNVGSTLEFPDLDVAFSGSSSSLHQGLPLSLTACSCCEENSMPTQNVQTFSFVSEAVSPIPNMRKCSEKPPSHATVVAGAWCRNMIMMDKNLCPEFMELDSNDLSFPGRTGNNIKTLCNAAKRRQDARCKSRRTIDGSEIEVPKFNHLREYILSVEAQKPKSGNISELNDGSQGYRGKGAVCKASDADMLSNITCDVSSKWNSTARFPISSQTSIHSGLNANVEQNLEQILQNGNVGTNVVQHLLQHCALKSFDGYKLHSPTIRNQTAARWGLGGARNGSNNHVASTNVNNRGLWETHRGGDMAMDWNVGSTMEFPDLDGAFSGSSCSLHQGLPPFLTACSCCEENSMPTQNVETFFSVSEAVSPIIPKMRKCSEKPPSHATVVAGAWCKNMIMMDKNLFSEFMELDSNDLSFGSPIPADSKKQPADIEMQSQEVVSASTDFTINAIASYGENKQSLGQKKQSSSDAAAMFEMSGTIITDGSVQQKAATPFKGYSPFSLLEIGNSISTGMDRFKRRIGRPVMEPRTTAAIGVDLIKMISESQGTDTLLMRKVYIITLCLSLFCLCFCFFSSL